MKVQKVWGTPDPTREGADERNSEVSDGPFSPGLGLVISRKSMNLSPNEAQS